MSENKNVPAAKQENLPDFLTQDKGLGTEDIGMGDVTVPRLKIVQALSEVKETTKLACVTIHPNANFSEIKSILDTFFTNIEATYKIEEMAMNSFIKGRVGEIIINDDGVGVIGEINPMVLEAWKLENPASCFEIDLEKTLGKILKKGTI